jgi:hypothetical protein
MESGRSPPVCITAERRGNFLFQDIEYAGTDPHFAVPID